MNILVIGNGFDLAHGLPTKYTDFLEFVKVIRQVVKTENREKLTDVNWGNVNIQIKEQIINYNMYGNKSILGQEKICNELLNHNIWIDYFLQCHMYQRENWIDFENEISRVIQSVDNDMKENSSDENSVIYKFTEPFLAEIFLDNHDLIEQERDMQAYEEIRKMEEQEETKWNIGKKTEYLNRYKEEHPIENLKEEITYKQVIARLEDDLDKLIRALEIYLVEYVSRIGVPKKSECVERLNPNHVLSFNYSDTYERLFGKEKKIEYDYIHGKADINNTIESNNMVLGIDEYLEPKRADKEISFIAFKKYYQRIYKGAGCKYKDWLYEMKESAKYTEEKLKAEYPIQIPFIKFSSNEKHNLFIFGHSLDVTDKDILSGLILNDNVYTKIFYLDKKDLKKKIANLVKVIGPDELIRRTGGSTRTIKFDKIVGEL